jgi:hypothetical protein
MRVLMFGWEFPPHIAGGLGTACYGLTRSLGKLGVDVNFVVPRAYGDEDQRFVRVVNASDVDATYTSAPVDTEEQELWRRVKFYEIDSNMVPYVTPEDFEKERKAFEESGSRAIHSQIGGDVWKERYTFSGKYGANLMEEVARYATVAAQVARDL